MAGSARSSRDLVGGDDAIEQRAEALGSALKR